jgi:protease-4
VKDVIKKMEGSEKSLVGANKLAGRFYPTQRWGERPKIGLVYAIGACAMDSGIKARELSKLIDALAGKRQVKAVVMRVNSPGGSALASDVVVESMRKCAKKKPVIVSQGDVAASGGYWISMYADEIVVQPTTITGSIGVIGGWVWDAGFGEKFGLDGDFVKRGEHADVLFGITVPVLGATVPHRALTDDERDRLIDEMNGLYQGFVGKVAEGRKMTKEAVEAVAQGRVWTGSEGKALGLVDSIGGIEMAIQIARQKAGIDPEDEVEILDFNTQGLFDISTLFGSPLPSLPFGSGARGEGPMEKEPEAPSLFDGYEMLYLREIVRNNGRALCLVPPDLLPRPVPESSE